MVGGGRGRRELVVGGGRQGGRRGLVVIEDERGKVVMDQVHVSLVHHSLTSTCTYLSSFL